MKQAENKKKRNKKVVTGTLAICLLAALGIGGTLAYLTDSEQVTNHFSMSDLDITLDEPHWDDDGDPENPDEPGDGEELTPGDSRDKDPTVEAVVGDSYMRVIMMVKDAGGELLDGEIEEFDYNEKLVAGTALSQDDLDALKASLNFQYDTTNALNAIQEKLDEAKSSGGEAAKYTLTADDVTTLKNAELAGAKAVELARLNLILDTIYFDKAYGGDEENENLIEGRAYTRLASYAGATSVLDFGDEVIGSGMVGSLKVGGTNTDDFTLDGTNSTVGRYYYNYTANGGIFEQGTKAVLFTDVIIPAEWNQTQMKLLGNYQIVLQAQAIQSANFDNMTDAFEALEEAEIANRTIQQNYGKVDKDSDVPFDIEESAVTP